MKTIVDNIDIYVAMPNRKKKDTTVIECEYGTVKEFLYRYNVAKCTVKTVSSRHTIEGKEYYLGVEKGHPLFSAFSELLLWNQLTTAEKIGLTNTINIRGFTIWSDKKCTSADIATVTKYVNEIIKSFKAF